MEAAEIPVNITMSAIVLTEHLDGEQKARIEAAMVAGNILRSDPTERTGTAEVGNLQARERFTKAGERLDAIDTISLAQWIYAGDPDDRPNQADTPIPDLR